MTDLCILFPGYYCENSISPVGNLTGHECPTGHYCEVQTASGQEHPCPVGTFNSKTGLQQQQDCQPCLPGYYCQNTGLSAPEGLCYAG